MNSKTVYAQPAKKEGAGAFVERGPAGYPHPSRITDGFPRALPGGMAQALVDLKYADEKGDLVSVEAGKQLWPMPIYEANLRAIAARLQKTGAHLIWASTTPVPEGANGRVAGSEAQYNAAAARVMEPSGILINDLHAVAGARRAEYQLPRDVHFTALGSQALAVAVAARVEAALGEATTPKD